MKRAAATAVCRAIAVADATMIGRVAFALVHDVTDIVSVDVDAPTSVDVLRA
ncbi:MAG: hypothetical protein ACLPKZ_09015 [Acidimicrobiales bacterium]